MNSIKRVDGRSEQCGIPLIICSVTVLCCENRSAWQENGDGKKGGGGWSPLENSSESKDLCQPLPNEFEILR